MRPVETIPGMKVERIKENDGEGKSNYDILKEFVNVLCTPSATII
jgi:hypothetical protein